MFAALPLNTQVVFSSDQQFQEVVRPYSKERITEFLADKYGIQVRVDSSLEPSQPENRISSTQQNLLHTVLYQDENLEVYYPETPRSPHQLSIVMKRNVKGVQDLNLEEQHKLHSMIKKINEIYVDQLGIGGFVVAEYSDLQKRHEGHCVVEVLPNQPGYSHCRNFLDKADSNVHVLYGDQNLTHLNVGLSKEEIDEQVNFWKKELHLSQESLDGEKLKIALPSQELDSHFAEIQGFALNHLLEIFENAGAQVINKPKHHFTVAQDTEVELKTRTVASCAFCRDAVIGRQKAIEYKDIYVLYNFRKMPYAGSSFLILPKRHTEKLYTLTQEEVANIGVIKKALIHVLKEKFPDFQVVVYNQDAPSVGQTVPHTHDQVVAIDPETIPLYWSLMTLAYNPNNVLGGVSEDEMLEVTQEFGQLLESEIQRLTQEDQSLACQEAFEYL